MRRPLLFLLACCASLIAARAATLEQLIADPQLWPADVVVLGTTRATLIKDGKPAGLMLVGGGKHLTVTGLSAEGVTGKLGGVTVRVPVDKTSLLAAASAAPASPPAEPAKPVANASANAATASAETPSGMQRLLQGKLVSASGGHLRPADSALAGVKYYALYYSASWCGPCRQFTPQLVSAYRDLKAQHPEFEVVFVSADHSAGDMADYMKADRMPWPAVKYDQRNDRIMRYSGPGIPCLVLVDAEGKVLSDSFRGDAYVGPHEVLADARRLLARNR